MADHYGAEKGNSWWSDAGVIYPDMPVANGTIPGQATQGNETTKPTVVQPFVVVPYVSQMQPLYQYDYSNTEAYPMSNEEYIEDSGSSSSVNIFKIFAMIFALLSIAVLVIGKFVSLDFLNIYGTNNGIGIIMGVMTTISEAKIMPMILTFGIIGVALTAVLILIFSIITIKGSSKVLKRILCAVQLICIIAVVVAVTQIGTFSDIGYGLYALAGIAVISFIF